MEKAEVTVPFLFVNPKSYLYGAQALKLAQACDQAAADYGITIFFTCLAIDMRLIAQNTKHILVTSQDMDPLRPGRGMGRLLPEAMVEAGTRAVSINHAEKSKTLAELQACVERAEELGLVCVIYVNTIAEVRAAAQLGADVIIAEPTALIGTGKAADPQYAEECIAAARDINSNIRIMIASGITTPEDCYQVVMHNADGTGATSGIINAPDPARQVRDMCEAIVRAKRDRDAVQLRNKQPV